MADCTSNRPERMSAVDPDTGRELLRALSHSRYDAKLQVSILTGGGDKAFSAGAVSLVKLY